MKDSQLDRQPVPHTLEAIRQFDTCTIANAIEQFGVRMRNEGYTRPGLVCVTGGSPTLLGYAATFRIRTSAPPMKGNSYLDRTDWWGAIERLPLPRIAVIQDLEAETGVGSALGEVHAAILKAFRCEGVITNGAVRDLTGIRKMQFPILARSLAVSHSYSHVVDYGQPVDILGLRVHVGDLLYADCHGVISIPNKIACEISETAAKIRAHEQQIIDVCQSSDFSPERLLRVIRSD